MMAAIRGGGDTNLGSVPGAVHGMVCEHEVGGGANDGSHEGGGEEPPHDLPVHAGAVTCTRGQTIGYSQFWLLRKNVASHNLHVT